MLCSVCAAESLPIIDTIYPAWSVHACPHIAPHIRLVLVVFLDRFSPWIQATVYGSSTSQRVSCHARRLTPPAVIAYTKERSPLFRGNATSLSNTALIRKGVFKIFFIFFCGRSAIYCARVYLLRALYIYMMRARAYTKVFPNCQVRVRGIFFIGKILHNPPPHPYPPSTISPPDQNPPLCNPRAIQLPWSRAAYFWIDLWPEFDSRGIRSP